MHLGTALLLLESVLVLVVEVAFVFTTAMTLQAGGEATGGRAAKTRDHVVVQERVKDAEDLKGANEIIEKLGRTLREQTIRRGDNHIRQHASPIIDYTGGGLSAAHFYGAAPTETKTTRTKHLKPPGPPSLSPSSGDANGHRPNVHAPKYMLDLYDKFSTDKYSHPMANIVRSFMNINEEEAIDAAEPGAAAAATTSIASNSSSSSHRVHRLLFNVTSIGRDEEIYLAELRLFTLVETDRQLYEGINRRVTVSEVIGITTSSSSSSSDATDDDGDGDGSGRLELIDSKEIYGRHSGWEKITITEAVRRWVKQRPQGDMHMLEVRIGTVGRLLKDESTSSRMSSSNSIGRNTSVPIFDINWRPNNENEPLLLVFSNDRRRHNNNNIYESDELNEIPEDDDDDDDDADVQADGGPDVHPNEPEVEYAYYEDELAYEYDDDVAAVVERRKKRETADDRGIRMRNRRGMASPPRVRRETEESEEWEEVDRLSASSADQIDYPVEIGKRIRMTRRNETRSTEEGEEDEEDVDDKKNFRFENGGNGGRGLVGRKRVRRSGKRKLRRNSCHRVPMYVNFADINWHNWILRPFGYQAYECTGRCNFPLHDHLTPTKHAIIQTMLNANYPKKAAETCCVPTKLEPISILYVDDQGIVTYKYKYDGMVVTECGCR